MSHAIDDPKQTSYWDLKMDLLKHMISHQNDKFSALHKRKAGLKIIPASMIFLAISVLSTYCCIVAQILEEATMLGKEFGLDLYMLYKPL